MTVVCKRFGVRVRMQACVLSLPLTAVGSIITPMITVDTFYFWGIHSLHSNTQNSCNVMSALSKPVSDAFYQRIPYR